MDVHMRKNTRRTAGHGSDSDSDDGPPPDPDEPASAPVPKKEKSRKPAEEAKEVHVSMRKADDKGMGAQGGLSTVRREMLTMLREEDDEPWQELSFNHGDVSERVFTI
jgi:DNA-directed RNA polymerase-3 subunit RPC5